MGKKSKKKKLKKKLRKLLRAQMAESEQETSVATPEIKPKKPLVPTIKSEIKQKSEAPISIAAPAPQPKKATLTENLNPYFNYDIKKILVTIGVIAIIITGIILIANFTDWLNLLSQKISALIKL